MKIINKLVYTDKQYIEKLEKRINKALDCLEISRVAYEKDGIENSYIADYNYEKAIKVLKGEEE